MKKYWIALFLAIAATQAVAGEKEYTLRRCELQEGDTDIRINDCNNCKEVAGHKLSFKVSKQLNSVMKISTKSDGSTHSSVIENCKIFDENNFKCVRETEAIYIEDYAVLGMLDELVVSNGKWEHTDKNKGYIRGEKVTPGKVQTYNCGYEKKWFKLF